MHISYLHVHCVHMHAFHIGMHYACMNAHCIQVHICISDVLWTPYYLPDTRISSMLSTMNASAIMASMPLLACNGSMYIHSMVYVMFLYASRRPAQYMHKTLRKATKLFTWFQCCINM